MQRILFSIAALILILTSTIHNSAFAQAVGTQWGAVSTAAAGAGRAAIESGESPALNPATIPWTRGYFATSDYTFLNQGSQLNIGLTDNLPETVIPTSLIYNQMQGQTETKQSWTSQQGQLEAANFYNRNLAFGLGARYRVDSFNATQTTQTNLLLGSLWTVTNDIGVAFTVDNFLNPDSSIPVDYRLVPGMSIGANYNYHRIMRFKLDVTTATNDSWSAPVVAGGLETHLSRWTILRLGGSHAYETGYDSYAAGLGFTGPKFTFNLGYYNCPENSLLTRQAVDLAIPIW